jgi:hypothetical protein
MKRPAVVALLIALIGCGGLKTFTTQQVSSLLPGKADTPPGLEFLPDSSGEQPVSQVVKDQDQQNKITSYGFQKAYASFYANSAAVTILSQQSGKADPSAHVIAMLAEVFKTADGAHKALALNYEKDAATGSNIRKISSKSYGNETLAEYGTQANFPFPGYLIYWRVGNTIFAVLDAGGPTAGASLDVAERYATQIDARAEKA